jgi:hypothetical protein
MRLHRGGGRWNQWESAGDAKNEKHCTHACPCENECLDMRGDVRARLRFLGGIGTLGASVKLLNSGNNVLSICVSSQGGDVRSNVVKHDAALSIVSQVNDFLNHVVCILILHHHVKRGSPVRIHPQQVC